jgi:hypothetical protein
MDGRPTELAAGNKKLRAFKRAELFCNVLFNFTGELAGKEIPARCITRRNTGTQRVSRSQNEMLDASCFAFFAQTCFAKIFLRVL